MADHNVGTLKVQLELDQSKFEQGSKKATTSLDNLKTKADETSKSGGILSEGIGQITDKFKSMLTPAALVTAGIAAVAAAATACVVVGDKMASTFDDVQVATGATGETLENLNKSLENVGSTASSTFDTLGAALGNLNTYLGLTGDELERLTVLTSKYADITGESSEATSEAISKMFNNWGVDASEYEKYMNQLYGLGQATGLSMSQIANQLVSNGALYRQMGFSVEEAAAQLSAFNKYGYSSGTVSTAMTAALKYMTANGIEPSVDAYTQLTDAIANSSSATESMSLAQEVFGTRAAFEMRDALMATNEEYKNLTSNMDSYNSALQDSIDLQRGGLSEAWTTFSNKLATVAMTVFTAVEPALVVLVNALSLVLDVITAVGTVVGNLIGWFTDFITSFKPIQDALSFFADIGSAIGQAWDWLTGNQANGSETMANDMTSVSESIDAATGSMRDYSASLDTAIQKTNQLTAASGAGTSGSDPYVNTGMNYYMENGYKIYSNGDRVKDNGTVYNNSITVQGGGYPTEEIARIYAYQQALNSMKARY
jgi:TP901 family phage tail tape measure protein